MTMLAKKLMFPMLVMGLLQIPIVHGSPPFSVGDRVRVKANRNVGQIVRTVTCHQASHPDERCAGQCKGGCYVQSDDPTPDVFYHYDELEKVRRRRRQRAT